MSMSLTVENSWETNGRVYKSGYGTLGLYVQGGVDMVQPRLIGLAIVDNFDPHFANGVWYEWDKVNGKVLAWTQDAFGAVDEVADQTDMSSEVFRWQAHGAF